jgi:hypothetical protein
LAHTQVWPALRYFEAMAPPCLRRGKLLTAISMSASSKTMNGALPPSSSESFLTVPAHCCISNLPTSVEPVKGQLADDRVQGQLAADLVRRTGDAGKHTPSECRR